MYATMPMRGTLRDLINVLLYGKQVAKQTISELNKANVNG